MASGSHGSNSNIPRNSILVHGVPVQNLPPMQGTHGLQRAQQMAPVHHQPHVQAPAAAQHQFLTAGMLHQNYKLISVSFLPTSS